VIDFDNLLLTVIGKGRKQRKVPFSTELRKLLFRFERISNVPIKDCRYSIAYGELLLRLPFHTVKGMVGNGSGVGVPTA